MYEVYLNPLVWGEGNVHVLGDRGTVRMELEDVKRFDSGVVLLRTSRPGRFHSRGLPARPPSAVRRRRRSAQAELATPGHVELRL